MPDVDLTDRSFLIVDDVRVTRIAINKLLKRFGDPETFHAENGHEAVSMLLGKAKEVDVIIADFNMPIMHGLQMMKLIRTGLNGIRRDIPVIMVTGHGERNLLGVALALDVNAFVLKPANKDALLSRIKRVLDMIDHKEKWIKPVESYTCIDADSTVENLLTKPADGVPQLADDPTAKAVAKVQERKRIKDKLNTVSGSTAKESSGGLPPSEVQPIGEDPENAVMVLLNQVQAGSVLAADILGSNKQKLISKGQTLTPNILARLKDLAEMGEPVAIICIQLPPSKH